MKLVDWKFKNLNIPMIQIEGELYTTTPTLCSAFQVPRRYLNDIYQRNREEFNRLQGR